MAGIAEILDKLIRAEAIDYECLDILVEEVKKQTTEKLNNEIE